MNLKSNDLSQWAESLADFTPDFIPIKATTPLQFFVLAGRKTVISKENLMPYENLHYTLYSPKEKRWYFKEYRGYNLNCFYYYRPTWDFGGDDEAVSNLRKYIEDKNIWLLLNQEQIDLTTEMLRRVYKANLNGTGKLDYKLWLEICRISLAMEDYKEFYSHGPGFKTQMKIYYDQLMELWKKVSQQK